MDINKVLASTVPQLINDMSANLPLTMRVRYLRGGDYPPEYVELRRQIYADEKGFLSEGRLFDANDANGEHILLYSKDGKLIAATAWTPAEKSDFGHYSGLAREDLHDSFYSSRSCVEKSNRQKGILALLLYLAMRRNREEGRSSYVGYVEPGETPAWRIMRYDFPKQAKPRTVVGASGQEYQVVPGVGSINEALLRCFAALPENLKEWVRTHAFTEEIAAHVVSRVRRFYQHRYFQCVHDGTLSRRQYLTSLVNKHHFVRWTTRVLGSAVSIAEQPELRKHYASHLAGEVNHEAWLENDICYLGGDLDFLLQQTVPDPGVLSFQLIQEALTFSRRDPVVFLGVPIAIEAITAFLDSAFLQGLKNCIRSWGYSEPSKACTFLASHVHTDGADEGHWIATLRLIPKFVQTEHQLQMILSTITLVINALTMAYDQYMAEPGLTLDPVRKPEWQKAMTQS